MCIETIFAVKIRCQSDPVLCSVVQSGESAAVSVAEKLCKVVFFQICTYDAYPAGVVGTVVSDLGFVRYHVEFEPAAVRGADDAFCTEDRAEIIVHAEKLEYVFDLCAAESAYCFDAPAVEYLVGMVVIVMVVTAVARVVVIVVMMFIVFMTVMVMIVTAVAGVVVIMMMMLVVFMFVVVMVVTAAAGVVVIVVMMFIVLMFVVVMVVTAAAGVVVVVVMIFIAVMFMPMIVAAAAGVIVIVVMMLIMFMVVFMHRQSLVFQSTLDGVA